MKSEREVARVQLFATPWTVAYQAPPSKGSSRQECWSGLPFPSPGDLPDPGIEPGSPTLQADTLPSELFIYGILIGLHPHTNTIHHHNRQAAAQTLQAYGACGPNAGPLNTHVLRETTTQAVR